MINSFNSNCPLCKGKGTQYFIRNNRVYIKCETCEGIYLEKSLILTKDAERARYEHHNNDVNDKGYQNFVAPICDVVMQNFSTLHSGLDFGAGPGPVISKILTDNNYSIQQYDPFFHNYPDLLNKTYDYIVCCEVMEHFRNPDKEFTLLKKLLKPNAKLFCYTDLYNETINFQNWHYLSDPTHIFIYNKNTIEWIKTNMGFSKMNILKKLITFWN